MRRHHLNRAIVLGLLLSTAMSGSVWAEDLTAAPIVVNTSEQKEYTITEDTEYDLTEDAWITNNGGSVTIEDSDEGNHDLSITTDNAKSINSTNGTNHIVVGGDFSLKNESSDKSIDGVYNFLGSSTTIKADGNITIESSANEKNSIIHAVTNKSMDDRTGESGKENTIEIVGGGTVSIKATSVTASDGNAIHSSAMSMRQQGVTKTTSIMGEGIEVAFEAVSRGDRINAGAIYAMSGGLGTISNTITLTGTGELDNTIIIYTSDQGFFLGEHGWFDKRFMYEECQRMPLIIRFPKAIKAGSTSNAISMNVDFAPTFLDFAGIEIPSDIQGSSLKPILENEGKTPADWRKAAYYHYYEYPAEHSVKRHYGIRTQDFKLIHFYNDIDEWEMYDMKADPREMNNVFGKPEYAEKQKELMRLLEDTQKQYKDTDPDEKETELFNGDRRLMKNR